MNSEKLVTLFGTVFSGGATELSDAEKKNLDRLKLALTKLGEGQPLTRERLNQLLHLLHQAGMSKGFYDFYFGTPDDDHIYATDTLAIVCDGGEVIPLQRPTPTAGAKITTFAQLGYGLGRFLYDALLLCGNVRSAYRTMRGLSRQKLRSLFRHLRFDPVGMANRLNALRLESIDAQDRYLVGETAQGHFGKNVEKGGSKIEDIILGAYSTWKSRVPLTVRELIEKIQKGEISLPKTLDANKHKVTPRLDYLRAGEHRLDTTVATEGDLQAALANLRKGWDVAWAAARVNTDLFLSVANDLDAYVATSMRLPKDFQRVADLCKFLFEDAESSLRDLYVRWFDPTLSIADDTHDKGLVECLMVRMAKVLVYDAGASDTYGKDAEAAMALSQGKPVLILCEEGLIATHDACDPFGNITIRAGEDIGAKRRALFKDLHPLSRLVDTKNGVLVGALVCSGRAQLRDLLHRIFTNRLQYELVVESRRGSHLPYLRLREKVTGSIVRLQTNYRMLAETFWNYYNESTFESEV